MNENEKQCGGCRLSWHACMEKWIVKCLINRNIMIYWCVQFVRMFQMRYFEINIAYDHFSHSKLHSARLAAVSHNWPLHCRHMCQKCVGMRLIIQSSIQSLVISVHSSSWTQHINYTRNAQTSSNTSRSFCLFVCQILIRTNFITHRPGHEWVLASNLAFALRTCYLQMRLLKWRAFLDIDIDS